MGTSRGLTAVLIVTLYAGPSLAVPVVPTPVPEPGSLGLYASGVAAAGAVWLLRRWKKRK